jgi:hypothetical protein
MTETVGLSFPVAALGRVLCAIRKFVALAAGVEVYAAVVIVNVAHPVLVVEGHVPDKGF